MSQTQSQTPINLANAFAGESQACQKYTFFSNLCLQLGYKDIAKLFRETAAQETQHAGSHFALLHPELVVEDASTLTEDQKKELVAKCLEMAVEGETYEFTTMYPEFLETAKAEKDAFAIAEFGEQIDESKEHAQMFKEANRRFGYLVSIEKHHAEQYQKTLELLLEQQANHSLDMESIKDKWICKKCSLIYDPAIGDVDGGILAGTKFEDIAEGWKCPICGAEKSMFVPLISILEK
jgi:rubrerythrin